MSKITLAIAILFVVSPAEVPAQHSLRGFPAAQGADANFTFPVPQSTSAAGKKDAAAVGLLRGYIAEVQRSGASVICASGQMLPGAASQGFEATLAIGRGDNQERLDFQSPQGQTSVRFDGVAAAVFQNGKLSSTLPLAAAKAGLFVTPRLLTALLDSPSASIQDDAEIRVGERKFHRITLSMPLGRANSHSRLIPPHLFSLYFEVESQLLDYAVDTVSLSSTSSSAHLRVISYGNYKQYASGIWPDEISEMRDGQHLWTLRLQDVSDKCSQGDTYFTTLEKVQ